MRFTQIVYLDPGLISEAYTEITGVSPVTSVSRSREVSGGLGAGILQFGGATNESREFRVSSTQMFFEIEQTLRRFPFVPAPACFRAAEPFWIEGILAVGAQTRKRNEEIVKEVYHFCIANAEQDFAKYVSLAANDTYFTSGYDQLAADKDILGTGMWEPVEALLRPIFMNRRTEAHLFAPFVILRRGSHANKGVDPTPGTAPRDSGGPSEG